jgi:hypothetical protein
MVFVAIVMVFVAIVMVFVAIVMVFVAIFVILVVRARVLVEDDEGFLGPTGIGPRNDPPEPGGPVETGRGRGWVGGGGDSEAEQG